MIALRWKMQLFGIAKNYFCLCYFEAKSNFSDYAWKRSALTFYFLLKRSLIVTKIDFFLGTYESVNILFNVRTRLVNFRLFFSEIGSLGFLKKKQFSTNMRKFDQIPLLSPFLTTDLFKSTI